MINEPTEHGPGSDGKMEVMTKRYANGLPLWHPNDAEMCSREPHQVIRPGERGRHVSTEPGILLHEGGGE